MQKKDLIFIACVLLFFLPFFVIDPLLETYKLFNQQHGMIMSFVKFAILATLGEVIGLRIKTGRYHQAGFGVLPRAVVWGILGLTIQMAFVIFSTGTPQFLAYLGLSGAPGILDHPGFSGLKLTTAFLTSTAMNLIYAPVMMTIHKITDTHIEQTGGTISGLLKPFNTGEIMAGINWRVQWGFVFRKTIPLFWIPAHTITFMLPGEYRVLFAALLGIMLGVLLAIAAVMGKKK
ncbi:MAG: hypothetical protein V2I46_02100 [Bacteroides sp.]|jgi:hypothetical protein|nr:hypothetical protein [Bacteroides sp.]